VLAEHSGVNIVASDTVTGQLSLRLKDLPWDQVLDLILQARGLEMRRHGEVLWIAPRDEMLARERLELEQKAMIADLEPLHAESFQLNYQRADTLRKALGIGEDGSTRPTAAMPCSRAGAAP
jgi:type IV pilus assembly protein PilQ